ncbi:MULTISPECIES: alpha/beta fold hydrolase [unclassified Mycobacterium]|uniref:alpha/beta fold hydrolase n=1 Tax=unclassified Mycobacterium TaxID=2642494 RepID=UPI0029C61059|nr:MULTISPECIES: alpha/beta fold hydrolase [unclassified Mycobacterium]
MPTVTTSRGTISYSDSAPEDGAGPPLLLLHANLHDSSDYAPVQDALSAGRRVIAVDWPGHGNSPATDPPLGAPDFGDVAVEFVDTLDLTNLVVIGNSVGGYAACRIALERPDRVAGLVLVNTGGFTPHTPFSRAFCAVMGRPVVIRTCAPFFARTYMRPKTAADAAIVSRVNARAKTPEGARIAAALWRSFSAPAHDLRGAAKDIKAPVLITWGAKDLTSPVRWGKVVAQAIPGARFTTLPTGHVVFSSEPQAWLREVVPFLDSAQASDRRAERPAARG